jgi:glycosyltransferase involved in cell wall biosynthesis
MGCDSFATSGKTQIPYKSPMVRRGWWKPTFIVPLVVFCGAHLGYDPAKVPIGGGAAVGNALIRRWMETKPFELWVLGTGEDLPFPGLKYHRVETPSARGLLTDFSVRKYARLSREFERGVVSFLSDLRRKLDPQDVLVLHNDIAEAGDFEAIARMGFRQVAIFHVDVVDYVANIYLRGKVDAPKLAKLWRKIISLRLDRVLPDVLKLMFSKQEACARFCDLLVVPSSGMAQVLRASYPWRSEGSIAVIPWGTLQEPEPPGVDEELANLKRVYKLDGRPVILTLSRISPEKGQDLLLRALKIWEKEVGKPLTVFICGSAAYMHGKSYMRQLLRLARKLRIVEVHFPGHVSGVRKHAFFRLADLYVFPSRHESYGLTMMEAMAAGLPVLTTNHRSAQDLVRPEFGLAVEPNAKSIYQGLAKLLCERTKLRAMGEEAQKFARSQPFSRAADFLAFHLLGLLREGQTTQLQFRYSR